MMDLAAVAAFDPPEPEHAKAGYQPGEHGPRAEAERLAMLHHLRRARACLLFLTDAVRSGPSDDETMNAWITQFDIETDRASGHLEVFRSLRECAGEG